MIGSIIPDYGDVLDNFERRLLAIEACKADYEAAHSLEDALRRDVLAYVASELPPAAPLRLMCEVALATAQIDFPRYAA